MPALYTYLISSLPVPQFGAKPPFTFEKFILVCSKLIPEKDAGILASIPQIEPGHYKGAHPTLKKWQDFEVALRNELVKARAGHKHVDPSQYLRQTDYLDSSLPHTAMNIHRNTSILEAEKALDLERWHFLEELSFGHYFDLDFLILYALKLLILERWEKIYTADKAKLLEEALAKI